MEQSPLRLIKRSAEYIPVDEINRMPLGVRGIYVLYKKRPRINSFDVVYVGMAKAGIRGRLKSHRRKKAGLWTHCSIFEVWQNIRDDEIAELEGLLINKCFYNFSDQVLHRPASPCVMQY